MYSRDQARELDKMLDRMELSDNPHVSSDFIRPMGVLEAEGRIMHAAIVGQPLQSAMPKHYLICAGDDAIEMVEAISYLDAMEYAIGKLGLDANSVAIRRVK